MKMSKIIVIVGPTATGKTNLSIKLAKKYNAQIINADSTQLYKEPLIATAKITKKEMDNIPHHMIDLITLNEQYSIYDYQLNGRKIINKLINENQNIIIVGGSGLYIKSLLYDYELNNEEQKKYDFSKYTNEELKSKADKISKNNIHINNRKRLERFITYYNNTGKVLEKNEKSNDRIYSFELIGLDASRDKLYDYIEKRTNKMFENGLLEEAKKIYSLNYKYYTNIIGYKELSLYFNNEITLEEAKTLIIRNTKHYAKRQLTWFKNQMKDIKWFNVDYDNFSNTINEIINYLDTK